jgi:hypothetical protein
MPDVTDRIPRSDMTADQRRRIGALQVAKQTFGSPSTTEHVTLLIKLAQYVETGRGGY